MYAPIVVFAYNRPNHLDKTLSALALNAEANRSKLFIYIDGPKDKKGKLVNCEVESVAKKYSSGYFKEVKIKNSISNKGLAKSVINGVTEIINEYNKVIVIEDDSVPSRYYLSFMNSALDYYEKDSRIWSIGGYTIPIKRLDDYCNDIIMTQRSSSYAWATWEDRWNKVDWEVSDYKNFHWNFYNRRQFNRWGNDRSSMLDDQMNGRIDSWAIRFDYAMFENKMYNIIPSRSLIENIGHDGSGTHNALDKSGTFSLKVDLSREVKYSFLSDIKVNEQIRTEFHKTFSYSWYALTKRFIGNLVYKNRWR